ncbi:MAG TPA: family 1 encapsulin nanocompartment shell protein [Streptosporangiaceae bacterium]
MNNLHRELAPVSEAAWEQIEQEAARTFKRHLAGRRVVDVHGPAGEAFSSVGTGRVREIDPPGDGVRARQHEVVALVELRAPFRLDRAEIDDVARGAQDADWQPVKDAARQIAFAEDRAIFEGYQAGGIGGIRAGSNHRPVILPAEVREYPVAIAQALSQLREAGVDGPYSLVLSADAYTAVSETTDHGYPVIEHIKRLLSGEIVWAPAIGGAVLLTTRGGDFSLQLGQDVAIGYLSHTEASVELYLQETLTFLMFTAEAAVGLTVAG